MAKQLTGGRKKKTDLPITKEDIIPVIQALAVHLGRTPTDRLFRACKREGEIEIPFSFKTAVKVFGSWNNCVVESGFSINRTAIQPGFTKESIHKILLDKYVETKTIPRRKDFYVNGKPSPFLNAISNQYRSFSKAVREAGIFGRCKYGRISYDEITNEEIISQLISLASELGHTPLRKEIDEKFFVPHGLIKRRFRTYTKLVHLAKLPAIRKGLGAVYTKEVLLEQFRSKAKELGRIPDMFDFLKVTGENACYSTFIKYFKRWDILIAEAGLEIAALPRIKRMTGMPQIKNGHLRKAMVTFVRSEFICKGKIPTINDVLQKNIPGLPKSFSDFKRKVGKFKNIVEEALRDELSITPR